jgi:hypothetical protein
VEEKKKTTVIECQATVCSEIRGYVCWFTGKTKMADKGHRKNEPRNGIEL